MQEGVTLTREICFSFVVLGHTHWFCGILQALCLGVTPSIKLIQEICFLRVIFIYTVTNIPVIEREKSSIHAHCNMPVIFRTQKLGEGSLK